MALLADSQDGLAKGHKHRGHVDVHVKLVVASKTNVNGRDLDSLAALTQVVELLPYQPVRVDGSIDSQGLVDLVLGSAARWVWSLLTRHQLQW